LDVGAGGRLCDVACGSGLAANIASRRGASVAGLDASAALIDIAKARTPEGDFRVGDMNALPFEDDSFDIVTSFNGIWKGCEPALDEVKRVVHQGGRFGMTFWGAHERMGLLPYFAKIVELSPPSHQAATMEIGETQLVAENMLRSMQFRVVAHGTVEVVAEWPDAATAVRALAAAGPAVPAIEAVGYETFCTELHQVIAPLHDPAIGVRVSSELGWITARSA
jgi:ubiquinone/menaquinone biosynthesis C-methylase UbiE